MRKDIADKNEPTPPDLHELERAKRLVEQEMAKQMEDERRNMERDRAEVEDVEKEDAEGDKELRY